MDIKEEDIYTWPCPAFPFRCFFEGSKLRIFFLENVSHNYLWLKKYRNYIRPTDLFIIQLGWDFSQSLARHAAFTIESLNLNKDNFFIMYNSMKEQSIGFSYGLQGELINHNAWINEDRFKIIKSEIKYDALYIARRSMFKRHMLASKISKLALVAGGHTFGESPCELPESINDPTKKLNRQEIIEMCAQSACGLCLSKIEGASYCSSEYLLCGLPVVSTFSDGGRDIWYTTNNSIVCGDSEASVLEAVEKIKEKKLNREEIRADHLLLSNFFRQKFIKHLEKIFKSRGLSSINAKSYFLEDFKRAHKDRRQFFYVNGPEILDKYFS
jgi:glycosyltransferase involved in cell wall biosynthesis